MKKNLLAIIPASAVVLVIPHHTHAAVIVSESLGSVAATTAISAHDTAGGFDHDALDFTGTGDIRATTASTGYTGASGGANAFLTSSGSSTFVISGISTLDHMAGTVDLSFGAYKSAISSDMTTLDVAYSSNGTDWTSLFIPAQPTGTGTAAWRMILFTDTAIPITNTLWLRWTNTDTTTSYRIDDVGLAATAIPEPAAAVMGAVGMCVMLLRRRG